MNYSLCPLCGSDAFSSIWQWKGMASGCCRYCGHAYTVQECEQFIQYRNFQQQFPREHLRDPQNALFQIAARRADAIARSPGRALEIGCAYGHFLYRLRAKGWTVQGIEPSVPESRFARDEFGLSVLTTEYGADSSCEHQYDLIAAFHVLEHLPEPGVFLARAHRELHPDGLLLIAVPDLRSLPRDFTELHFIAEGLHRHTFHPLSLRSLLESHGFEIVEAGEESPTPMSPSSYRVTAVRREKPNKTVTTPTNGCELIAAYHEKMDLYRATVKEHFRQWRDQGERIALLGGGSHTQAVVELCELGEMDVYCIIDDAPCKQGQRLSGIPIVSRDSIQADRCERVVVSTLSAEMRVTDELRSLWPDKQIIGFYRDLIQNL